MRLILSAAALTGLLASPAAYACGGFFCNQAQPVIQNAERIAFGIDARGMTEAHVQIFYQGPSDEFAWVVPVPTNPDIFISSDALFDQLSVQLAPIFQMNIVEEGRCTEGGLPFRSENMLMAAEDASANSATTFSGSVDVLQQGQVGPYDMAVLQGSSTDALLDWLLNNNYDLPPGIEPVLEPYVADQSYFLALKLQKDKETGDIAPIGFRYMGDKPGVPIQLTSIAAADDMRLETYVFANQRVVPESYLHVKINEAAVDWWSFGTNYPDVITQAANEAGGHAFATDYAGSPERLRGSLYAAHRFDMEALRAASDFDQVVAEVQIQGWPANAQLQNALAACVDGPTGVDPQDFLNCPSCYDWDEASFEPDECADILEVGFVEPLMAGEALFEHAWVSRMTSSLDAAEMTVDPVFVRNPDMKTVDNQHSADFVYECKGGKRRNKAMRRLDLSDGREILIPSENWMEDNNMTPFEFIEELGAINAAIIEETGSSGKPNVIQDHTNTLFDQMDEHNNMVKQLMGCGGCSNTGSTGGLWLAGLAVVGLLRRRRDDSVTAQ